MNSVNGNQAAAAPNPALHFGPTRAQNCHVKLAWSLRDHIGQHVAAGKPGMNS